MKTKVTSTVLGLLCALSLNASAQNLLTNGSFEDPIFNGGYLDIPAGSTEISGWTVGSPGGINLLHYYWPASDGFNSIDLSSGISGPGSISQAVLLTSGVTYRLSFDMAYNTDYGVPVSVKVGVGEVTNTFTRPPGSSTPFWQPQSFVFTATTTGMTTISFAENSGTASGSPEVAIDKVVLEADCPAEVALLQFQLTNTTESITRLSNLLGAKFQDANFQITGATPDLQVSNLVWAIEHLNQGQQQAIFKKLSGQKKSF